MSGHSKWSKVKHQKAVTDNVKGKLFTKLAKAITLAVRQAGGITDPDSNYKLRLAIEKAKSFNLPKENIKRAIDRAIRTNASGQLEEITYEAFGPAGVGIIIQTATDNKQRTIASIKNILEKSGGRLASHGSVIHLFQYVGLINAIKGEKTSDELMEKALDAGAIDFEDDEDGVEIYTEPEELHKVKDDLVSKGVRVTDFELFLKPMTTVPIEDIQVSNQILKLLARLEEEDDVQKVSANFDIPDEYLK